MFALINPDLTDTGKRRAQIATPGPVPNHPDKPFWVPIVDEITDTSITAEKVFEPVVITIEATRLLRSQLIRDKTAAEITADDTARVEGTFTGHGIHRAFAQMFFQINNRVRVLEGNAPLTVAQFKAALRGLIR